LNDAPPLINSFAARFSSTRLAQKDNDTTSHQQQLKTNIKHEQPLDTPPDFFYEAPFRVSVRRLKILSLFSCACAIFGGPVIVFLDQSAALSAKISLAAALSSFGILTTGILHWFTKPYLQNLSHWKATDTVEITALNVLAKPKAIRFKVGETTEPKSVHPLTSFEIYGKYYFVDPDNFRNNELLERMAPAQMEEYRARQASIARAIEENKQREIKRKEGMKMK
jgi:hypothetical protein